MTLESFVTIYGYPALLAGSLMEGETIVLLAGFLAHGGHLSLPLVMLTAFAGAFIADQTFFQVGKRKGKTFLDSRPKWEPRVDRIRRFLVSYQVIAILAYRFIYGMRTITPVVIGASGFSTPRFVGLNLCSTALWAVAISSAGYFFGHLFEQILKDVQRYELAIIAAITAVAATIWFFRHRRKKDQEEEGV
jgi:membrane protein DedA with SNARE-associated domain